MKLPESRIARKCNPSEVEVVVIIDHYVSTLTLNINYQIIKLLSKITRNCSPSKGELIVIIFSRVL